MATETDPELRRRVVGMLVRDNAGPGGGPTRRMPMAAGGKRRMPAASAPRRPKLSAMRSAAMRR